MIVSGGVSVGPHDHVKPALAALGVDELFWRVALQPGKPTWFGQSPATAARVRAARQSGLGRRHLHAVRRPGAGRAAGRARAPAASRRGARSAVDVRRNPQREQAIRVRLVPGAGGLPAPNGAQDSHLLSSLLGADALAMIPAGAGRAAAGDVVALSARRD